ncbi:UDP-glucose/GDP-mannose dehydrogenase family protein [Methanosarcina sp. KYL-1]|uniref:UDP-glucose dehydrogenase family protein n=1 Tax=Methanosarcina sp. KYL-1 TaxID=2602068 RepID=UPI00210071E4|nr:UDP-glucose/GDP-mannose dehydrogenase family protein [Methanosarcina sp. KYL-1]MCQ1535110.1 UDP-glucose/GDP-mannose dehydrogenase family protein [Methanosarcina sp. KYL-1]
MKVSVIGSGYVGSVTAACFADAGHEVVCVDVDEKKVEQINKGVPPIYEEGLEELLQKYAGKRLIATTDYEFAVKETEISFICVGTPSGEDGSIDLSIVRAAAGSIGAALKEKEGYHVVVVKSTVVPETTEKVVLPILEEKSGRKAGKDLGVAMNPEFLREGKAVYDFMHPDKIVVGAIDRKAGDLVSELYRDFGCEVTRTIPRTAEMIKYANNSFLATKISFANEIGNICKKMGIDTYEVMQAVGKDFRISPNFLNSGAGFGGSCFPKDVKALIGKAKDIGYSPVLLESVIAVNEKQPLLMTELLQKKIGDPEGRKIAVLGLAFKNDTDDIRESRAIPVIAELLRLGAKVSAYDPMAADSMKKVFPTIEYFESAAEALKDAEACLVMTEWEEFKTLDSEFEGMKEKIVIDGRRVIKAKNVDYEGLCW